MAKRVARQRPGSTSTLQASVEPINTGSEPAAAAAPELRQREQAREVWEQLGTYVPPEVARALRMHAAAERAEIRDIVTEALRAHPALAPYLAGE